MTSTVSAESLEKWKAMFSDIAPPHRLPHLPDFLTWCGVDRIEELAARLKSGKSLRKGRTLSEWESAVLKACFGISVTECGGAPKLSSQENYLDVPSAWQGVPLLESLWREEWIVVQKIASLLFSASLVRKAGGEHQIWWRETAALQRRLNGLLTHQVLILHVLAFPDPQRDWWLIADYRGTQHCWDYESIVEWIQESVGFPSEYIIKRAACSLNAVKGKLQKALQLQSSTKPSRK